MKTEIDVIQGSGQLGKNDVPWVQANSTCVPPDQMVNKAEELTNLSTNIVFTYVPNGQWMAKLNLDANLEVLLCMSL